MKSPILKASNEPDIKWSSLIENFHEEIPDDIIGLEFKSKSASFVNNKNEKLPTSKESLNSHYLAISMEHLDTVKV